MSLIDRPERSTDNRLVASRHEGPARRARLGAQRLIMHGMARFEDTREVVCGDEDEARREAHTQEAREADPQVEWIYLRRSGANRDWVARRVPRNWKPGDPPITADPPLSRGERVNKAVDWAGSKVFDLFTGWYDHNH